jgi:predicted negative regulator of RcsB-dependent stress response
MSLQIQPQPEEQQPSADLTLSVLTWLEENKKILAIGCAVVSAAAVTLIIQKNVQASAEAEANQALLSTLSAAAKTGGPSAADLSKVASQHSGTAAAERSEFLAATKLFEDGKYAEAQKALEAFNQAHADSLLGGAATYGVASALDAQNKTVEAIAALVDSGIFVIILSISFVVSAPCVVRGQAVGRWILGVCQRNADALKVALARWRIGGGDEYRVGKRL